MTELRSFTRHHLEGALALFPAEDWQTSTADPATHGFRGNDRAATDGGL
jgi:hypothetical protein